MILDNCPTEQVWRDWTDTQPDGSFLQSWDWGEFQRLVGYEPMRFLFRNVDGPVNGAQGFCHRLGPGLSYLYMPRIGRLSAEAIKLLKDESKRLGCVFIRWEPEEVFDTSEITAYPTKTRQPAQTLVIPLDLEEGVILAQMHTKTRYNIRVAQKHGVQVSAKKDASVFWQLNQETIARDQFKSHDAAYYEQMLACPIAYQFTAYANETPIASIICIGSGKTFTYLHGASSNAQRNLMAPYLLQWEAMRFAKAQGFAHYDMWGIAPLVEPEASDTQCLHNKCWSEAHAWSGITRFKVGFGGVYKLYPKAQEIPVRTFLYRVFLFMKTLKNRNKL